MSGSYIYEHLRQDNGAVFYVGKGKGRRALQKQGRNKDWENIAKDAGGFAVRFVAENIEGDELAYLAEQERIDQLRKLNAALCNQTDGGLGMLGTRHTDEWRENMRNSMVGKKRPLEVCKNISTGKRGKSITEQHKASIRAGLLGEKNHMWGKTHDDAAREKIRQSRANCARLECPHCGKVADAANAHRWHFDNCKLKGKQNG